jgi:hypothetical protein
MSAGFQVVEVISTIGRFDISQSVGTRDSKERFGPETVSGTKIDPKSIPSGRCGSHGLSQALYRKPESDGDKLMNSASG